MFFVFIPMAVGSVFVWAMAGQAEQAPLKPAQIAQQSSCVRHALTDRAQQLSLVKGANLVLNEQDLGDAKAMCSTQAQIQAQHAALTASR